MSAKKIAAYRRTLDCVGELSAIARANLDTSGNVDIEADCGKALDMITALLPFVTREELEGAMKDAAFWGVK